MFLGLKMVFSPPNHQCFLLHSTRSLRHIHTCTHMHAHIHTPILPSGVCWQSVSQRQEERLITTETHTGGTPASNYAHLCTRSHSQTPLTALSNMSHNKISLIMLSVCMFVFLSSSAKNRQQSEEREREREDKR